MLNKHSTIAQTRGFLEDPREGSEIRNSRQPLDSSWVQHYLFWSSCKGLL